MSMPPLAVLTLALASLIPSCTPPSMEEEGKTTAASQRPIKETTSSYTRPYGRNAPWNVPVAGLPRHPENEKYADLLWFKASDRPGNFNIRMQEYTYPVYSTKDATGFFPVETDWPSNLHEKLIPWNPAWRPAPGSDAQVIVLDVENGKEWNLYKVKMPFDGVIRAVNANLVPGDYRTRVEGFAPSRGVGIPYLAMLVRPEEIVQGSIDHALSMPIRNPSGQYYVPPATKLENATGEVGIPEGMRFAIDVTDDEIEEWVSGLDVPLSQKRAARIIASALRDYGWFITDVSGSAGFQFESLVSADDDWERVGLDVVRRGYAVYPRDLLDGLITRDRVYVIVDSEKY
ncbi:hypothetical protein EF888_01495 [Silicimonas algicola]|uniref:Uncharacterized protein n=1 Tax=Silicimonas algicola TaxID=1826607 RepID=A0A316GC79_9RHOB|nr:hypothetical protein [Silicimonas algicola]AZQ65920.1 hypothetical protein EF888_01495 [Silicimonas algicola]PWK58203.1 hypothetical protein C8D95_1018 [Silicimonas algicola]